MTHATDVDAVRRFSRFYTRHIGLLHEGLLGSPFSLSEGRVLYELGVRRETTATLLAADLGLDAGYLSRIVKTFVAKKLVRQTPSANDARQNTLVLTKAGRAAFEAIDTQSRNDIGALLRALPRDARSRVVRAMMDIETTLSGPPIAPPPVVLRAHRPGDMGWIIHRHAALYAQEYGWDGTFEAMVARVAAEFIERFDATRERCFIAEHDGSIVGSAFVVKKSARVAKLRLVYVEPVMRGTGLGRRLVDSCLQYARDAGYSRMTLWTNDVLVPARRLYEAFGFELIASEAYRGFGKDLVGETWERNL